MRFSVTLLTALVAVLPFSSVLAAPAPLLDVHAFRGEKHTGSYIVTLKKNVNKKSWLSKRPNLAKQEYDSAFINGFAGSLDEDVLNELRANPDVESIAEDGIMHTMATVTQ